MRPDTSSIVLGSEAESIAMRCLYNSPSLTETLASETLPAATTCRRKKESAGKRAMHLSRASSQTMTGQIEGLCTAHRRLEDFAVR